MKKSLWGGVFFLGLVFIAAIVNKEWHLIYQISGGVGLTTAVLSALFAGAFLNGDRTRANFYSEGKAEKAQRLRFSAYLFFFGLPNLLAAIGYWWLTQ